MTEYAITIKFRAQDAEDAEKIRELARAMLSPEPLVIDSYRRFRFLPPVAEEPKQDAGQP